MIAPFAHSALAVVAKTFGDLVAPPVPMPPSVWAENHLIVPDGPGVGELWDLTLTPYIEEPLNFIGPDSVVNEIAAMKSAQTGFTTLIIAAIGHSIDRDPCRIMVVQPPHAALSDFNRDKLQPAIDTTDVLRAKVAPQTSRSSEGSTTYSKKYPKGSLTLAIATSAADLRSKTVKKLFRDEIDQYPDDLDGQGDPIEISDGRLMSFLETRDWKKIDISTPTIKGGSKIETRYEAGDQRRWHVPCPHCRAADGTPSRFVFENGPHFRFDTTWPHKAHYVAPCCGSIIHGHEKNGLVRQGHWVATQPRPGAFPSYHFDTFSSPFVPWDEIAKAIIAAGDNPQKLKTLWNLWFGLPFEMKGDAPDHVRLMERRADNLARGHVPPRGLLLVAAADVQMRGIWVEILAIASDRQSWVVDAFYIDGGTESPADGAFAQLNAMVLDRDFPDAFGGRRQVDAFGIDSGYRSHVVYSWVRANQRQHAITGRDRVLAVDGRDGWGRPPIGTPKLVDIDLAGRKVRQGCQLWPIGTWPLKGGFYADLRKEGLRSGAPVDPEGYCHFGAWLDDTYFRQITSEYLADELFKGRYRKVWKRKPSEPDNHLLDCFDPQTQVLTESGWVSIAEATLVMRFATVNLSTDEIEYQLPTEVISRHHCGEMVEIKGRRIDILVTPGHRMVTYRTNPVRLAPEITLAGDLRIWDKIKLTACWRGLEIEYVEVPEAHLTCRGNNRNKQNGAQQQAKRVDAGDLAEFLGWYVAEGHRGKGEGYHFAVALTQMLGEKQDRIVELMTRLGWVPRVEDEQRIIVHSKQLFTLVKECYEDGQGRGCYRKCVPGWIKSASPRIIARFLEGAVAGDGWTQRGFRTYATTSVKLADDVQELFIKLGRASNIKEVDPPNYTIDGQSGSTRRQYHVTECKTRSAPLRRSDNTPLFRNVAYDGLVHCVSVPNETLICRRNGKSFIAGNCRVYNLALAEYLGLSSLTQDEWAGLAKLRGIPGEVWRETLFTLPGAPAALPKPAAPPADETEPSDIFARFAAMNAGVE